VVERDAGGPWQRHDQDWGLIFSGLSMRSSTYRSFGGGGGKAASPPSHPRVVSGWQAESKGGDSKPETVEGYTWTTARVTTCGGVGEPPLIAFVVSGEFRLKRKCW
jgi:hypothetical protein